MSVSLVHTDEGRRAAKLAAARKKLKTFRASRSSAPSHSPTPSASSSTSRSPHPSLTFSTPLNPSTADNYLPPSPRSPRSAIFSGTGKGKDKGREADSDSRGHRYRQSGIWSQSSGHWRRGSSVGGGGGRRRGSIIGVFDLPPFPAHMVSVSSESEGSSGREVRALALPSEIITTPATPLIESPVLDPVFKPRHDGSGDDIATDGKGNGSEDEKATRSRLSTFSFGAKPPYNLPRTAAPTKRVARRGQPLPPLALRAHDLTHFPTSPTNSPPSHGSNIHRLSTPLSHPPSLLLTKPTPAMYSPTSGALLSDALLTGAPATPPLPARKKRHSHTRSESISLPNLKLGRPTSLGVPSPTNSFPSSPCSPASTGVGEGSARSRIAGPINGTRLKFEPSGRGAEAEMEKEESRRKALEKLTGGSSPRMEEEERGTEIALPDLDDEDGTSTSTSSSIRPLSGIYGSLTFSFARPSSVTLPSLSSSSSTTPSNRSSTGSPNSFAFSSGWASPRDEGSSRDSPTDRWSDSSSGFSSGFGAFKEDGLGFGLDLGPSSGMPISLPLGSGAMGMNKRGSVVANAIGMGMSGLSVLAEEDEAEDEAETGEGQETSDAPGSARPADMPTEEEQKEQQGKKQEETPIVAPTPSRLRALHLVSSISGSVASTPVRDEAAITRGLTLSRTPSRSTSPTKGYGAIGRGRPRPLSGIGLANATAIGGSATASAGTFSTSSTSSTGSPVTSTITTPRTASTVGGPRRAPRSGSGTRSSISYKKGDSKVRPRPRSGSASASVSGSMGTGGSSTSSRDWSSMGSRGYGVGSPPPNGREVQVPDVGSPPFSFSPKSAGWGMSAPMSLPRSGAVPRPCPRPRSLVGLGLEGRGAGRVLGEVMEEEDQHPHENGNRWGTSALPTTTLSFRGFDVQGVGVPESVHSPSISAGRVSSEISGDSGSFGSSQWRDPSIEIAMERDALREDVDLWRKRCRGLEERLEGERKEVGLLRERVRKLGDRLSTVSTSHPPERIALPSPDAMAELTRQLFSLTTSLEKERREKEEAMKRLGGLEKELMEERRRNGRLGAVTVTVPGSQVEPSTFWSKMRDKGRELDVVNTDTDTDLVDVNVHSDEFAKADGPAPFFRPRVDFSMTSARSTHAPIVTPSTPVVPTMDEPTPGSTPQYNKGSAEGDTHDQHDANLHRIKAWGFPSAPLAKSKAQTSNKGMNKRESFFGLSASLRATTDEEYDMGVDLPPIVLHTDTVSSEQNVIVSSQSPASDLAIPAIGLRAVSEPVTEPHPHGHPQAQVRSASLTSTAASATTSALSFLGGYLPISKSPKREPKQLERMSSGEPDARSSTSSLGAGGKVQRHELGTKGGLDFKSACRCCVGEVIDL